MATTMLSPKTVATGTRSLLIPFNRRLSSLTKDRKTSDACRFSLVKRVDPPNTQGTHKGDVKASAPFAWLLSLLQHQLPELSPSPDFIRSHLDQGYLGIFRPLGTKPLFQLLLPKLLFQFHVIFNFSSAPHCNEAWA